MYRGIYFLVHKTWPVKEWPSLGSWASVKNWLKEWPTFGSGNYCIKLAFLRSDLLLGVASSSEIFSLDRQCPMDSSLILWVTHACQSSMSVTLQPLMLVTGSPTANPRGPDTAEFYNNRRNRIYMINKKFNKIIQNIPNLCLHDNVKIAFLKPADQITLLNQDGTIGTNIFCIKSKLFIILLNTMQPK